MSTVHGIPTTVNEVCDGEYVPMAPDKARFVLVTITATNGIFYKDHVTTSRAAGVMQTTDVYTPGSWIWNLTGEITGLHADVLGYVNGDSRQARAMFKTIPGALVNRHSKKTR